MTVEEVQELIENYNSLTERQSRLFARLERSNGKNPLQEESLIQRLEALESKLKWIEYYLFDSEFLSDKETTFLLLRADGYTLESIAEMFFMTRQGVQKRLSDCYKKIANDNKAA